MVDDSGMNLLFFLGVLIPALITVALFIVFCVCWYRMRIRNQILYKKYDPHGIDKLGEGQIYEPPPPPPPPFKSNMTLFLENNANNNNVNKNKTNDNYEESPEPTEGFDNQLMYRVKPDSGFSDLNQIQCNMVGNHHAQLQNSDMLRPRSQASDDSDDSGFRSSRSGQYIHSASNSSGNAHEQCQTVQNEHSFHDTAPLFKPIKIHPNENGLLPSVSYVHRNSGKHKPVRHRSMLQPSHTNTADLEFQSLNNIHTISHLQSPFQFGTPRHVCNTNSHLCHMEHISKSNYDVHGGKLHSTDSHVRPLTSVGHVGPVTSTYNMGHVPFLSHNGSQPHSIGYGSDFDSLVQQQHYGHQGFMANPNQLKRDFPYHLPQTSISMSRKTPISTHIPPFSESHFNSNQNMDVQRNMQNVSAPLQMSTHESPMELTVTQAMVHRPYLEELSDPSLYSVV